MQAKEMNSKIDQMPEKIGVYIFRGAHDTLYIGKATNIKKRVKNHIQSAKVKKREKKIVDSIKKIEYIVTDNETDALIEENILIKRYKPKYNVQLRDDKTYPYLKIDLSNIYPFLCISRRIKDDQGRYFGPYSDVGAMRNSIKSIRRIFPIRMCKKDLQKFNDRPCLYHRINQCIAPCEGKISLKDYNKIVTQLILFLEGKRRQVIHNLRSEMKDASLRLNYEKAAILRDQISDLEKIMQEVRVVLSTNENLDAIALSRIDNDNCVQVLQVREGKILSSESFEMKISNEVDNKDILESFLKQYYSRRILIPDKIIVNLPIKDTTIAPWLSRKFNRKISIKKPRDKKLNTILIIAENNAQIYLEQSRKTQEKNAKALGNLKKDLKLNKIPRVIECYDVSNLGEKEAVGSKIAFYEGKPNKKEYRMYKIKTISTQDDQAMIGEIIKRRFNRLLKEDRRQPDLIVVDGGLLQVKVAKMELDKLKINVPVIGLAKKKEDIYLPNGEVLGLDRNSNSSLLLQHVRDEAHRFAIRYHKKRRDKIN
jgi:excinuclease ABC subunit C